MNGRYLRCEGAFKNVFFFLIYLPSTVDSLGNATFIDGR